MTDEPIEIIKRVYEVEEGVIPFKSLQKKVDEACSRLLLEQNEKLNEYLIYLTNNKETPRACEIATSVKLTTTQDLSPFLLLLVEKRKLGFSPFLFQGAPPFIRDKLIERVENESDLVLCALAWIGDVSVVGLFSDWRNQPPNWAKTIYLAPHEYAKSAGWEVTESGTRRELCSDTCIPFLKTEDPSAESEVDIFLNASEECPWCKGSLEFVFNVRPEVIPDKNLINRNQNFQFLVCKSCVWLTDAIYSEVASTGNSFWSKANHLDTEPQQNKKSPIRSNMLIKSETVRNPYYSSQRIAELSQIGGHPSWQQDPDYPACPGCSQAMIFFGQVDYSDIDENEEGIFYSFFCDQCHQYNAVTFQST